MVGSEDVVEEKPAFVFYSNLCSFLYKNININFTTCQTSSGEPTQESLERTAESAEDAHAISDSSESTTSSSAGSVSEISDTLSASRKTDEK